MGVVTWHNLSHSLIKLDDPGYLITTTTFKKK